MSQLCAISLLCLSALAQESATFTLIGDWDVRVALSGATTQTLHVAPPVMLTVNAEKYDSIPIFNPKAGGWIKGAQLVGVRAQETTSPHLLDAASFILRAGRETDSPTFTKGADYEIDLDWGTFGRLAESRIKTDQPVYANYRHAQQRLDAVVLTQSGEIVLRQGTPRAAAPSNPPLSTGDRHLGNIYLPGFIPKLEADHLFPILERSFPEQPIPSTAIIERLKKRLNAGEALRILAWGDSVTDAT